MGVFNEGQAEAARRAWKASTAEGIELKTQKSLERLSATYFWASMGMDRRGSAAGARWGDGAPAAAEGVAPQLTRHAGGEVPGADGN